MADLSPAAQAVLDACDRAIDREMTSLAFDPFREPLTRDIAAAAMRAAADQAQASLYYTTHVTVWSKGWKQGVSDAAQGFLAIAAELEGQP